MLLGKNITGKNGFACLKDGPNNFIGYYYILISMLLKKSNLGSNLVLFDFTKISKNLNIKSRYIFQLIN